MVAGDIIWLLCAACGIVFTLLSHSETALTNSLIYGAFLCGGLEFLIVSGAFTETTSLALAVIAVHPTATLILIRLPELAVQFDPLPFIFGGAAFGIVGSFTFFLRRKKTNRGFNAVTLFQAFMKTWAGGTSADLESMISGHSETTDMTTKIMRFQREGGDIYVVLPAIHPGPFYAVGSYDLPGAMSKAFAGVGPVLTLHRPGGHEKNLATRNDTSEYTKLLADFAPKITTSEGMTTIRGPIHTRIGKATVCAMAFSQDLLVTVTFSPLGSDDIEAGVENRLWTVATRLGLDVSIVDAHNSLDHTQVLLDVEDPAWERFFQAVREAQGSPFRVSHSQSNEVGFTHAGDITENGISLLMIESEGSKHVLVLADANNAVPSLRSEVATALDGAGYKLIEVCTSDSHDLAARGLTVSRGYEALGEATPIRSIAMTVVEMAKLAESRLSPGRYGSGALTKTLRVFGSNALEEFARVTEESSTLGRTYTRFAVASIATLLLLAIVF